jgi:ureidoglycolate lyase
MRNALKIQGGTIMKEIKAKDLTRENFNALGTFEKITEPTLKSGRPVEFYPDLVRLFVGQNIASICVCRVAKRPYDVTGIEMHRNCGEGIMPIDGDIIVHLAPSSRNGVFPVDKIEAFRVPKGTFVALHRGVWHLAPFAVDKDVVNVLVVLPERTYAEDCVFYEIPEDQRIKIVE